MRSIGVLTSQLHGHPLCHLPGFSLQRVLQSEEITGYSSRIQTILLDITKKQLLSTESQILNSLRIA